MKQSSVMFAFVGFSILSAIMVCIPLQPLAECFGMLSVLAVLYWFFGDFDED